MMEYRKMITWGLNIGLSVLVAVMVVREYSRVGNLFYLTAQHTAASERFVKSMADTMVVSQADLVASRKVIADALLVSQKAVADALALSQADAVVNRKAVADALVLSQKAVADALLVNQRTVADAIALNRSEIIGNKKDIAELMATTTEAVLANRKLLLDLQKK